MTWLSDRLTPLPFLCALLTFPSPMAAQWWLPRVEVAAGGGFAGVRVAQVGSRPAVDCVAGGPCQPVPDQIELFDATRRVWKPALATGVVLRWRAHYVENDPDPDEAFGLGVGGQMVFVPAGDETRILPGVTFHAGTKTTQLFAGFLLAKFDKVVLPSGLDRIRVPTGTEANFVQPDADNRANFFVGIVVGGVAVTK